MKKLVALRLSAMMLCVCCAALAEVPEVAAVTERIDVDFLLEHSYLLLPKPQLKELSALADKLPKIDGSSYNFESAMAAISERISSGEAPSFSMDKIDMAAINYMLTMATFLFD